MLYGFYFSFKTSAPHCILIAGELVSEMLIIIFQSLRIFNVCIIRIVERVKKKLNPAQLS